MITSTFSHKRSSSQRQPPNHVLSASRRRQIHAVCTSTLLHGERIHYKFKGCFKLAIHTRFKTRSRGFPKRTQTTEFMTFSERSTSYLKLAEQRDQRGIRAAPGRAHRWFKSTLLCCSYGIGLQRVPAPRLGRKPTSDQTAY